jgi:hypothetical protein
MRRIEFKLFLAFWLVYAVYVTPAGGALPNRYLDLVHSIVNEGRFAIDTYHDNTTDVAFFAAHYFSSGLPGTAFAGVPVYVVFKSVYAWIPPSVRDTLSQVQSLKKNKLAQTEFYGHQDNTEFFLSEGFLTLFLLAPISALGSMFLYKATRRLTRNSATALLVALCYAFGTSVFFFSTVLFEHVIGASLGVSAFYILTTLYHQPRAKIGILPIFGVGFLTGLGLLVEYPTVLISLWLGGWTCLIVGARKSLYYLLGLVIPLGILMLYNDTIFNNPFTSAYAHLIGFQEIHGVGFFGFTFPRPDNLVALLFGTQAGLLIFSPIALLGAGGLGYSILKRGATRVPAILCGGIFASYILLFSAYQNPLGPATFGPRYLIGSLPFLLIGVGFLPQSVPGRLVLAFAGVSIFINWLGAQFGFAENILQPVHTFIAQGPTLPIFVMLLTHTSQGSVLHTFAERYHILITLLVSFALIALFILLFRNAFDSKSSRDKAQTSFAENPGDEQLAHL